MKRSRKPWLKRIVWISLLIFLLMNVIAYFHAYKFTHFSTTTGAKTRDGAKLSLGAKLKTLLFGINNPRPVNNRKPSVPFETLVLKSNKDIECWYIKHQQPIGTVILFHGFSGEKSAEIDQAKVFNALGYNTLLVDFMGSGGSAGNQTTIGFYEAQEVKTAIDYVQGLGEQNIILYGTSMGAAAVMKCINDVQPDIKGIIIECPFGTMLKTVQARFTTMHLPTFPMANLLVFWGGLQNNFNAFSHNPEEYAKHIKCPVLLMYGQKDDKVSRSETDNIYQNLPGEKQLKLFPLAGHEDYLKLYPVEWTAGVTACLDDMNKQQSTIK